MSNSILALSGFKGLAWPIKKSPMFSTTVQTAASFRETRVGWVQYPIFKYGLTFDYLSVTDVATMQGFFMNRLGRYDSFLITDQDDYTVTAQALGTGDASTVAFQLVRTYGSFTQPVYDLNGSALIYNTNWQGTQLQYTTARTNSLLQSRTLTNASWTKTNTTAAKDQTGPDGTLNGACSLLATAGNATTLQAITLTSAARTFSFWVKRLVGTGTIQMTMDNGSSYTTIATTATWTRFTVTQTLANPTVGFRIVTNADKIAVDFGQVETGATATSAITTTTVAVSYTDYSISSSALATFTTAPAVADLITGTFTYYWRVRFMEDVNEIEKFMSGFYELKQLDLMGVLP